MADTYFTGLYGLQQAIVTATNGQETMTMAHNAIMHAYDMGGDLAVRQLAGQYGINYTPTELAYGYLSDGWTITKEVTNSGLSPFMQQQLYQEVVDASVNTATNEVVFETAKQVTTKNGLKTFVKGAVKTVTENIALVGAIATGIDLGWESYKEHPDFWTDFSESIFSPYQSPDGPFEVLARAHSGGYTTAVKEKEIGRILTGLAKTGAFDYYKYDSSLEDDIPDYTTVDATWSSVGASGTACALAYDNAINNYPNSTIVETIGDYEISPTQIRGAVLICENANLPSRIGVYHNDSIGLYFCYRLNCHYVGCDYNPETETASYFGDTNVYDIVSGSYIDHNTGQLVTGGFCVNKEMVYADNELFPNNHTASNISLSPSSTIEDAIAELRNKQPNWYDNSWTQDTFNPNTGEVESERYYPITIPWWNASEDTDKPPEYDKSEAQKGDVKPDSDPKAQEQGKEATKNNPKYETDPRMKPLAPTPNPTPTPTDPGGGAGGTSDALWSVYNPTMQELNDLGAYLWTNNIVELLEKFLQNPMDAIISLHKIYCTPDTGAPKHIILGYLDSNVSSAVVTNQFKTIDCGSVDVPEYFADARDYDIPYTNVECYLPFVGIVKLKTQDIIGGRVNIVYTVDVYSGACLCKIFVTKLGAKQLLYNFSGNCSMQIPLTGADRTRLLSGAITGAVTGAFAGAQVGAVVGAVAGAFMGGTSIDRTSQFSANAGCMGVKKPYLIITRKYSYDAGNYNKYYGFPSNITVALGSCKGFTKVKSAHIQNLLRATSNEKDRIEILLKQGVIIN